MPLNLKRIELHAAGAESNILVRGGPFSKAPRKCLGATPQKPCLMLATPFTISVLCILAKNKKLYKTVVSFFTQISMSIFFKKVSLPSNYTINPYIWMYIFETLKVIWHSKEVSIKDPLCHAKIQKNVASSQHYRSPLKAYTNNQSCRLLVYANQTISLHSLARQINGGKTKTLKPSPNAPKTKLVTRTLRFDKR